MPISVRDSGTWKHPTETEVDEGVVFSHTDTRYAGNYQSLPHTFGSTDWGRLMSEPTGIVVEDGCRYEVRMNAKFELSNSPQGGGGGNYDWRYNVKMAAGDLNNHFSWSASKFTGQFDWSPEHNPLLSESVTVGSGAMDVDRHGTTLPVGSQIHGEIWIKGLQNGGTLVFKDLNFELIVHRWRAIPDVWVRDSGSWKKATEVYVRDGGTWKVPS